MAILKKATGTGEDKRQRESMKNHTASLQLPCCHTWFWLKTQERSLLKLLPCCTLRPVSSNWMFTLHLLPGSSSKNPTGEQNNGSIFWGTRTPLAPSWKPSSCAGHESYSTGQECTKDGGWGWRSSAQHTTFLVPDDALNEGLFVEPKLSWD